MLARATRPEAARRRARRRRRVPRCRRPRRPQRAGGSQRGRTARRVHSHGWRIRRSSCTSTSRGRCGRRRCSRSRGATTTRFPPTVEELPALYEFRDFAHFIEVWILTTNALRTRDDFRQVVVDYAAEAAAHGAVYVEGIFSPAERVRRGVGWDEVFSGYCDGAQEARELHGVEVRLTPDIPRGFPLDEASRSARYAAKYRDRGVVGLGLGGLEARVPARAVRAGVRARARRRARLGAARRRGRRAGVGARRARRARRRPDPPRHPRGRGPGLAARARRAGDRARRLPDLEPAHAARSRRSTSIRCRSCSPPASVLDLHRRPRDVRHRPDARLRGGGSLGSTPRAFYDAGVAGALCDEETKTRFEGSARPPIGRRRLLS